MPLPYNSEDLKNAVILDNLKLAAELLEQGDPVDAVNGKGVSALMLAIPVGNSAMSRAKAGARQDIVTLLEGAIARRVAGERPDNAYVTWIKTGDHLIEHVSFFPASKSKVTEVFDLAARRKYEVSETMGAKRGHKEMKAPVSFDDLPPMLLVEAMKEFWQQGGAAARSFVLHGKKPPAPKS